MGNERIVMVDRHRFPRDPRVPRGLFTGLRYFIPTMLRPFCGVLS